MKSNNLKLVSKNVQPSLQMAKLLEKWGTVIKDKNAILSVKQAKKRTTQNESLVDGLERDLKNPVMAPRILAWLQFLTNFLECSLTERRIHAQLVQEKRLLKGKCKCKK